MSKYTTGEMAKLCDVTVRTVQYYDNRNILAPSELSQGGRRVYNDEDLKKLKIICFLRGVGLSIDNISKILEDEKIEDIIKIMLEQQSEELKKQILDNKKKLQLIEQIKNDIKNFEEISIDTIGDIAITMKKQKNLKKIHVTMFVVGIIVDVIGIGALLFWIFKGIWIPFAICVPLIIITCIYLTRLYYKNTAYICPKCHQTFKTSASEFLFAKHTPKTRKLTCTKCGHKGFCVEVYNDK